MLNSPTSAPVEEFASSQIPWLEVSGIKKSYFGITALKGVSLNIERGRVHGLVGANGAGKSTLIKCLAGAEEPDFGSIKLEGNEVVIQNPSDSMHLGFAFIHQEVSVIPHFDVFRNMVLGIKPNTRLGIIDWRGLRSKAEEIHAQLSMKFSLDTRIDDLSVAEKWLVLIGRALMQDAVLIAMDEPTASLSIQEIEDVHEIIRGLVRVGVAVLFVSHRLDEVIELCDVVTIFRDGEIVNEYKRGQVDKQDLVREIVGREVIRSKNSKVSSKGKIVLEVKDLSDKKLLRDITFSLHEGEVLGLSGLVGSGRTELAKIIYGANRKSHGSIKIFDKLVDFKSPADAIRAHIGFVPEERRAEGIFATQSITFNISIARLSSSILSKFLPLLNVRKMRKTAAELSDLVTVNTKNMRQGILTLSGGNQQKVVIARWLGEQTKLLILDEPSRGVDVGAREEIHRVIRNLAKQGTSIIVISSDDEELEAVCDRVITLVEGTITSEVQGPELTAENLRSLSFGKRS
jgi:ABC-type sugar transport system ATPase subunit